MANPDWFFTDSNTYGDAYLHTPFEDNTDNIFFKIILPTGVETAIPGIVLPKNSFDNADLINYVQDEYNFANQNLKVDMLNMLKMSGESHFKAVPFLQELVKILHAYMIARDIPRQD